MRPRSEGWVRSGTSRASLLSQRTIADVGRLGAALASRQAALLLAELSFPSAEGSLCGP